ncbi:MAG: type II secretion system F family protein [Planctomycetia bacterium]|nr:type II secretion system F family protein [Planctomycetia bacterium]
MPTYQFEAMDSTGQEIKDVIEAATQEEAQATIRQRGYFVTKIAVKKARKDAKSKAAGRAAGRKGRSIAIGGVSSKQLTSFTRQLSILQDAGLPILRSLRILENQSKPGRLKNSLMDVCEEIEAGSTLSEAMGKSPKAFNRLFVNMVRAGEAGGALEVILRRLAEFQEKAEALKRKVKGAMVYPVVVVFVAVGILTFIMIKIVPSFQKIFSEFKLPLPLMTNILIGVSEFTLHYGFLIPLIPTAIWLLVKLLRKFEMGRYGWDGFIIKMPVFGQLVEKNIMARTTRTLGTLVSSGVPILEAMNITKETSGNAIFERLYGKVTESIREGESISKPMKEHSNLIFNPICAFFWAFFVVGPLGLLLYMGRLRQRVIDDLVVNMVDVGEETGELDTMLYKVADTYDDEVKVLTESLVSLMEPILIVGLGLMIGFIVIALFLPLIALINSLTGGG